MKRLVIAVAAAAAAAPIVLGTATADPAGGPATLELEQRERDARTGYVDNPPRRRESAGDVFTIRGPVRTPDGDRAGRAHVEFVQTGRRSAQGSATFVLREGRLVVAGALEGRGGDTLAVVGGTGAYADAAGTVRITEAPGRTRFLFTLVR